VVHEAPAPVPEVQHPVRHQAQLPVRGQELRPAFRQAQVPQLVLLLVPALRVRHGALRLRFPAIARLPLLVAPAVLPVAAPVAAALLAAPLQVQVRLLPTHPRQAMPTSRSGAKRT
jgi:hypothetical protein